jgi:hypothetical protein
MAPHKLSYKPALQLVPRQKKHIRDRELNPILEGSQHRRRLPACDIPLSDFPIERAVSRPRDGSPRGRRNPGVLPLSSAAEMFMARKKEQVLIPKIGRLIEELGHHPRC